MEIIGKAVKHMPEEIRFQYPEIPWKQAAGLRDVLISRLLGSQYVEGD
jgi:uncharacterized protein with HEPN domain